MSPNHVPSCQCDDATDDRHGHNCNENLEEENDEEVREGIMDVARKSNTNKSTTNTTSNMTTARPCNDTDDNESSSAQEEEEVKEKSMDVANNCELMSNNDDCNIMSLACIAHKHCNCGF